MLTAWQAENDCVYTLTYTYIELHYDTLFEYSKNKKVLVQGAK